MSRKKKRNNGFLFVILLVVAFGAFYWYGDNISFKREAPESFKELSRKYSPDSSRYLLKYRYEQGVLDDKTSFTCILNTNDDINDPNENKDIRKVSFASTDADNIYWKDNDTIVLAEKYTKFKSDGKSRFKDSVFLFSGAIIKVIHKDPIDSSYSRKIIYRETSPDNKHELVVYRYVKPVKDYYFLNISVVEVNGSIPKFGNFFIAKYDYDCISDIRWNNSNELSIKAPADCYYSFKDYLVKNQPDIKYDLKLDESGKGNIKE